MCRTSGCNAPGPGPPLLLPTLLPSRWTTLARHRQIWNIGPAHRPHRTALDDAPTPTDQKVGGSSPSERAQVKGRLPFSNRPSLCPRTATGSNWRDRRLLDAGLAGTGNTRLVLVGLVAVELVAQPPTSSRLDYPSRSRRLQDASRRCVIGIRRPWTHRPLNRDRQLSGRWGTD